MIVIRVPSGDARKSSLGGLTAKGRAYFNARGANLRPGVMKVRTAQDMRRKASFLLRHYKGEWNEAKPLADAKGRPTRHALQAQAWGEKAPRTIADVRRLAAVGARLLKAYHNMRARG